MKVEAFFDDIQTQIKVKIQASKKSIKIAVAYFTDKEIFNLLCLKAERGVEVQLIISAEDVNFSKGDVLFDNLLNSNGELFICITDEKGILHNKFCIIDENILITGSYNWSYQAKKNLENIIIVEDHPELCQKFSTEYEKIKSFSVKRLRNNPLRTLKTEVNEFDRVFGGLYASSIIVFCSKSENDLSHFILSFLNNLIIKKEHKIVYLSLRDSEDVISKRMISVRSGLPFGKMKTGNLSEYELKKAYSTLEEISNTNFLLKTPIKFQIEELKGFSRTLLYKENDIRLLVVEDLTRIEHKNTFSRSKNLEDSIIELKRVANELNIPVITTINIMEERKGNSSAESHEVLSLKEYADTVYQVKKPEYYADFSNGTNDYYDLVALKNRHGNTMTIRLNKDFGSATPSTEVVPGFRESPKTIDFDEAPF